MDFVRLWLHEAGRVYGDKLIENKDMELLSKLKFNIAKEVFEVSYDECSVCGQRNFIFANYVHEYTNGGYMITYIYMSGGEMPHPKIPILP